MSKPMKVVILSHPDTPVVDVKYLAAVMRDFAKNIGCAMRVRRFQTNLQIPRGQVFIAGENELWVKKMKRKTKRTEREAT